MKKLLQGMLANLREWRAKRAETRFERGYRENVQRVHAATLPLSQIGNGTAEAFVPSRRPGTLTIVFGDERVTLDPMSSHEKYMRDSAKADELIDKMAAMAAKGKAA